MADERRVLFHSSGNEPTPQVSTSFVLETDQVPEVWQFLNGLRGDDLLVELIVNELDAGSSFTEIRFEPDRLVCSGEGAAVDEEGWERLRMLKGAGHKVKAKAGLFGVKNHGLKACFTLGNDILVRSAGRQILQTLFANGHDRPAYPGVRVPPLADPAAPDQGTRIEVPYRREEFTAPHGEALVFQGVTDADVGAHFVEAVKTLPGRLMSVVRPGVMSEYRLRLSHHAQGTHTFHFKCGPPRREGSLVTFSRECRRLEDNEMVAREQAALAVWSPQQFEKRPRFFQAAYHRARGKRLFSVDGVVLEVAWTIDNSGRPRARPEPGRLRYPVAYPGDAPAACTGTGMHYAGPLVSDTERHGLGEQAGAWNDALIAECDRIAVEALVKLLLPRHGAPALRLISDLADQDRLRRFADRLLAARAFPAQDTTGARCTVEKGAMLVVPVYLGGASKWSPPLAKVAPPSWPVLDPRTPVPFVGLLADGECAGWGKTHGRFDEGNVLDRLEGPGAKFFPWKSEAQWRRALAQPGVARAHLDALYAAPPDAERPLTPSKVHLPGVDGKLYPLSELRRGVSLPVDLPELPLPPVIHSALRDHPIFKRRAWKLDAYEFRDMLADGQLRSRSEAVRKRFFGWLYKNHAEVERDDWPALRTLPIWPAMNGSLHSFDGLCEPASDIAAILRRHLRRPRRDVKELCTFVTRRVRLRTRELPRPDEVAAFYRARVAAFPSGRALDRLERAAFRAFEAEVSNLCRSRGLARALEALATEATALDRAGRVRPVAALVRETPEVGRARLCEHHLLDRPLEELDQVFPPAVKPTPTMVLEALRHDPQQDALLARLKIAVSGMEPTALRALRDLACIPVEGCLRAPAELAFKGNVGDFWGNWKRSIGAAGLSDNAQTLYKAAGVLPGNPDPTTSRAFFEWLAKQPPAVLARNLAPVIRHLAHPKGVASWRLQPPEIACVPVEGPSGVGLLTLSDAKRFAAVDDFPELAAEIRASARPTGRRLTVHAVEGCAQPVSDQLKSWGVPTLATLAKGPLDATGQDTAPAAPHLLRTIKHVGASSIGRRLRRQLESLDVPQSSIHAQYQARLGAITRVMVARNLRVRFKLGQQTFQVGRRWAVLPDEVWLDLEGDADDLLASALADLVFVAPRPRYLAAALGRALSIEVRDHKASWEVGSEDQGRVNDETLDDLAGSAQRHPGGDPQPALNQPKPGPLHIGGAAERQRSASGGRAQAPDEEVQRRQLKAEHYAHHCQVDLATRLPTELAPVGSYAEFAENRRRIMEAHHPDKVEAGGSRHAGNLLILSALNHGKLGSSLSRAHVTKALQAASASRTILNPDGTAWLKGVVATIVDPVSGQATRIFFTHEHRRYWLEMAGVLEEPSSSAAESDATSSQEPTNTRSGRGAQTPAK